MFNRPVLSAAFVCVWAGSVLAATEDGGTSGIPTTIYIVIGIAVAVGVIAILMRFRRGLGRDEGIPRGPRAGDGAAVHHQSGEIDFDGSGGAALSKRKDPERDLPYPPERAAD